MTIPYVFNDAEIELVEAFCRDNGFDVEIDGPKVAVKIKAGDDRFSRKPGPCTSPYIAQLHNFWSFRQEPSGTLYLNWSGEIGEDVYLTPHPYHTGRDFVEEMVRAISTANPGIELKMPADAQLASMPTSFLTSDEIAAIREFADALNLRVESPVEGSGTVTLTIPAGHKHFLWRQNRQAGPLILDVEGVSQRAAPGNKRCVRPLPGQSAADFLAALVAGLEDAPAPFGIAS